MRRSGLAAMAAWKKVAVRHLTNPYLRSRVHSGVAGRALHVEPALSAPATSTACATVLPPFLRHSLGEARGYFSTNPLQRQSGAKPTLAHQTTASTPQKQSSAKGTQASATASKDSQAKGGGSAAGSPQSGGSPPNPPQSGWLKGNAVYIGAFSVFVVALFMLYPDNWSKKLFSSQNKRDESLRQKMTVDNKTSEEQPMDSKESLSEDMKSSLSEEQHEQYMGDSLLNEDKTCVKLANHEQYTGDSLQNEDKSGVKLANHDDVQKIDDAPSSLSNLDSESTSHAGGPATEAQEVVLPDKEFNKNEQIPAITVNSSKLKQEGDPTTAPETTIDELQSLSDEAYKEGHPLEPLPKTIDHPKTRLSISEAYYLPDKQEAQLSEGFEAESSTGQHEAAESFHNKDLGDEIPGKQHESVRDAFDFLEVIHAAERRQEEIDARFHEEEKRKLKEFFQKELKDAQAKEVMYAEEANRLAKEIERERERASVALKLQQEKADERLEELLNQKEEERSLELKKAELLRKAQVAAAVAQEKASYLKDTKDVNLQLEALHTAFYTRSEEARQSHTVHKLAVGTFAMEDAMKRGAPVDKEIVLLLSATEGSNSDPLLDAAIHSLPKDILQRGTDTPAQLHQKFKTMEGAVRELSLMPAVGGGLLSHAAARVVSALKMTESGQFSDGIEAIISQVQSYLADGKLADAADLLEKGVQGTKAEDLVSEWVKHARERAALEQTVLLLQAHATAVAASLV